MYKNKFVLPDGTEISSGAGTINAIQSVTITSCVNSEMELTLGSACADMVEATIFTPNGNLNIAAGADITVFEEKNGNTYQVGLFTLETPTRPSANKYKITAYDHVTWLDKDLTEWLRKPEIVEGFPYSLLTFAGMVCEACGLHLVTTDIPNADYQVKQFAPAGVTGRKLMRWIGEMCGRFCRADSEGDIELAKYTHSPMIVDARSEGGNYAFSMSLEDYTVQAIDMVQISMATGDQGYLWPVADEGANTYIISGNPLIVDVTEDMRPVLDRILLEIPWGYTPCKVTVPAELPIHAGNRITVVDMNGVSHTALVMNVKISGQKAELECTGSARRNSASAANNKTPEHLANSAVNSLTQEEIFNKLTNNGQVQGIYLQDNKVHVNADFIKGGKILAEYDAYIPPTYDDAVRVHRHALFPELYPKPEGAEYDLDGNGSINDQDGILAMQVARGEIQMENCKGAVKKPVTVMLNPSDPYKTLYIYGVNQWGTLVETCIGLQTNIIDYKEDTDNPNCRYFLASNGEKEWVDPPMKPNVEYRTTERHDGKIVYVKRIIMGSLPNATYGTLTFGFSQAEEVIHIEGEIHDGGYIHKFPYVNNSGNAMAWFYSVNSNYVQVWTKSDLRDASAEFTVKFTR